MVVPSPFDSPAAVCILGGAHWYSSLAQCWVYACLQSRLSSLFQRCQFPGIGNHWSEQEVARDCQEHMGECGGGGGGLLCLHRGKVESG